MLFPASTEDADHSQMTMGDYIVLLILNFMKISLLKMYRQLVTGRRLCRVNVYHVLFLRYNRLCDNGFAHCYCQENKIGQLTPPELAFITPYEEVFGKNASIPVASDTRWSIFYRQLSTVVNIDKKALNDLLTKT